MGHALRKALGVIAVLQGRGQAAGTAIVVAQAGVPELAASSLKAALDRDWDDPGARDGALAEVLGLLQTVEAFVASQPATRRRPRRWQPPARSVTRTWTWPANTALRRGVAKDRRISVEDAQMRHGRKSRSVLFDGYKRHVLRDLDTAWCPRSGSPRQGPSQRHRRHRGRLAGRRMSLAELHIDRLTCPRPWSATADGPAIFCKACGSATPAPVRQGRVHPRLRRRQLTCPPGPCRSSGKTYGSQGHCAPAAAQRCTASSTAQRPSIRRALLAELRSASRRRRENCVNASRSSTRLPTSALQAAAPATWHP